MNNEALDKAVIEYNGLCPKQAEGNDSLTIITHHLDGSKTELHLVRSEFEQRAKELGFINGYRWGVKYPTNGKRPDLPDDVVVKVAGKFIKGNWYSYNYKVDSVDWLDSVSFKITDQRYKPADTSYLQTPAVKPVEEVAHGDWFELGMLPPTGTVVAFYNDDGYAKTGYMQEWLEGDELEILSHKKVNNRILCVVFNRRTEDAQCLVTDCMRPLDYATRKAGMEKSRVVDKLKHDVYLCAINPSDEISMRQSTGENLAASVISYLYDLGWRPTK